MFDLLSLPKYSFALDLPVPSAEIKWHVPGTDEDTVALMWTGSMVNFGVTTAVSAESITTEAGVDEAFTVKQSF